MFSRMMRGLAAAALILVLLAGAAPAAPPLEPWRLRAEISKSGALLSNERMALYFPKSGEAFSRYEVWMAGKEPRLMGVVTPFSRLLVVAGDDEERRIDIAPTNCTDISESQENVKALRFTQSFKDEDGVRWQFAATFSLSLDRPWCEVRYTLSADTGRRVVQFRGPTLFPGDLTFGTAKDAALFPGLEYLLHDERSSSRLAVTSRERKRFAPHPYKVTVPLMAVLQDRGLVGLLWNPRQRWDGRWECPQPIFSSPNWLEGKENHLMMLSVPSSPWHEEYAAKAATPYPLKEGTVLSVECKLLARPAQHVTEAVGDWLNAFGYPEVPPKTKSWEEAVEASLKPYLGSLWRETGSEFGWLPWTGAAPIVTGDTCAALLIGADISRDADGAKKLRARIDHARAKAGLDKTSASLAYGYRFGTADRAVANNGEDVRALIAMQKPDGSWVFDPPDGRTLIGVPVESLGERGDTAVGLCAAPAARVLKYALVTGDSNAAQAGLMALEFMEKFVRPQAAQTWECPLNAPDILAAAQAADAYLQGYLLTGENRYLERARYWAWTGAPFIYLWNASDRHTMLYSSIAIFGASMYTWPWFGRPVQWSGLAYADILRRLAEHDRSFDWRTLSKGIAISATLQQATEGENAGLYPDSWNLLDDASSGPWLQPGHFLLSNLLGNLGREVDPRTLILRRQQGRVHITAAGRIEANLNEAAKAVWVRVTDSAATRPVVISVAGLGKPASVTCGEVRLASAGSLAPGAWTYRDGILFVEAPKAGPVSFRMTYDRLSFALPVKETGPAVMVKFLTTSAVAGQAAECKVRFRNRSDGPVVLIDSALEAPKGWTVISPPKGQSKRIEPGTATDVTFKITPSYSDSGMRQWLGVKAQYGTAKAVESARGGAAIKVGMPITVRPYIEDTLGLQVIEGVQLSNPGPSQISGTAVLVPPQGWSAAPSAAEFVLAPKVRDTLKFTAAAPEGTQPARYQGKLRLTIGGERLPEIDAPLEIAVACNRLLTPVRINGNLREWDESVFHPISRTIDGEDKIKGPQDLSARMGLAWNEQFLYLAFAVTDDKFLQTRQGPEIWRQDSIQVGFDTLRDANTGGYEDDDYEYGFALTPTDVLAWRWQAPPEKAVGRVPDIEVAIVRQGEKTIYEIGIPWRELSPFTPAAGRSFAMSVLINDDDGAGRKSLEWGGGLIKQKQPSKFVGVRLRG